MPWISTRMSTMQMNLSHTNFVNKSQVDLNKAGHELATGKKADIYGDVGPRVSIAFTMRTREENTQAYILGNNLLDNKLQATLDTVQAIRGSIEEVFQNAVLNTQKPTEGSFALQGQARAAIEAVITNLNLSFNGEHVFSGTTSGVAPMNEWTVTNPDTGLSPDDVIQTLVGPGPTAAGDTATIMTDLDAVFGSSHATANYNYEATFFNGTPELDGGGQPNARVEARIGEGRTLMHGVQANDLPVRDLMKGLSMLAAVDVNTIADPAAYTEWMEEATSALSSGVQGMLNMATEIGFNQSILERASSDLEGLSILQTKQISELEAVDPYEAATRLSALETQLQASYTVSSRLSDLSILNYLR